MMRDRSRTLKPLIVIVTALTLVLFPFGFSIFVEGPSAFARVVQQPIDFTPNVFQLEMTSVVATAIAEGLVAPTPTFGAGQLYSDEVKPDVSGIEGGDDEFGYGQSVQDPDVYYVWMTDENGTHYITVDADSEELLGSLDEATNSRRNNGYIHLIEERTGKLQEVSDAENDVNHHQTLRMSSHSGALGAAAAGGLICGILTGGACYIAFGIAAITAWVAGVVQNGEKIAAQDNLERLEGQLEFIDSRLRDKFGQTMRSESTP